MFFRRVAMHAAEAIQWYRSEASSFLTPMPGDVDGRLPGDGIPVSVGVLHEPTRWPVLGIPISSNRLLDPDEPGTPFRWGERVHRRIGDPGPARIALDDPEAAAFLARRLHVELGEYPEHVGGLALVAPDPYLRIVEHFPVPARVEGGAERIALRLVPRRPGGLAGLKVLVSEVRLGLLTRLDKLAVPEGGLVVLDSPGRAGASGFTVLHPTEGVIRHVGPLHFLRSHGLQVETSVRQFEVTAPLSEKADAPLERSVVVEYEAGPKSIIGDRTEDPIAARILLADRTRRAASHARRFEQTLLEDRRVALEFMRHRVARARESILVADPYLGGLQVRQVVQHATRTAVKIRLLTSGQAFGEREDGGVSRAEAIQARRARFSQAVAELRARDFDVIARFMAGKRPPLHDRFLVVDGAVWMLGNSINGIGDRRLSLAIQLPDPDPVIARLGKIFKDAISFDDPFPSGASGDEKSG